MFESLWNVWITTAARDTNAARPLSNKLLVLIDGRSVYTPLFSGVYLNVQDTLLEDVDRIEVIRGPGATLWGANAVNGVINIITKEASNTQNGIIIAGAGNELKGEGGARFGGAASGRGDEITLHQYWHTGSTRTRPIAAEA